MTISNSFYSASTPSDTRKRLPTSALSAENMLSIIFVVLPGRSMCHGFLTHACKSSCKSLSRFAAFLGCLSAGNLCQGLCRVLLASVAICYLLLLLGLLFHLLNPLLPLTDAQRTIFPEVVHRLVAGLLTCWLSS